MKPEARRTTQRKVPSGRAHAERSAATRRRIIASAIRVLQQRGYEHASLQNIARGARVTLGAVQHQFGTRDGLLLAVIDQLFFQQHHHPSLWTDLPGPLPDRAREFIRRIWDMNHGQPHYIASWNLFFGCRSSGPLFARIDAIRREGNPGVDEKFFEAFPELGRHGRQTEAFAQFFWSSLRGIALLRLFNEPDRRLQDQLDALAATLVWAGTVPDASATARQQGGT